MKKWVLWFFLAPLAWTDSGSGLESGWKLRQSPTGLAPLTGTVTQVPQAFLAFSAAEAGQSGAAESLLAPYLGWLADYPRLQDVHGQREPAWLHGEADQAALVTLALLELEKLRPDPRRREQISQFAQGLALLHHPATQTYPFGAHTSFDSARRDSPAYVPGAEAKAPGALWRAERSFAVHALADASQYLGDKTLLEEAQTEALALWAHLAVSGRWVWGFVPRPTGQSTILGSAAGVDNFLALQRATRQEAYGLLAGLAGRANLAQKPANEAEWAAQEWVRKRLRGTTAENWLNYEDAAPPVSYQVMEAENGKAVQKAFDIVDVVYPDGEPGKMVRVGRDQMFWMRFDIEREDDYFFYLIFLKSHLEGGLVSVLMRIDGDKIFQVNLGGASDPYVDMDFVDGPRPLRSGPHSFGIRFAGLLMTQPALLDSVIAWPVVERRFLRWGNRRLLVLHNLSQKAARATCPEVRTWPPEKVQVVDGLGQSATLTRESDRRRRKDYVIVPPGGLAWLEWQE